MRKSRQRRGTTHPQSRPYKIISIQNSQIIQIKTPQLSPLFKPSSILLLFIKVKSSLNNQISSYLDTGMSLSRRRSRSSTLRLSPSHYLQIQQIQIIKIILSIPPPKYKHLSPSNQISTMSKPLRRRPRSIL